MKNETKKIMRQMRNKGWRIHFGPCDETGRNATAGVGVMWKEDEVKIYPEVMKDQDLIRASEQGRAGKYMMNSGWGEITCATQCTEHLEERKMQLR